MKSLLLLSMLVCMSNCIQAQTDSIACPVFKLQGPRNNSVTAGTDAEFTLKPAKKTTIDKDALSYQWTTDNGIINKEKSNYFNVNTKGLEGEKIKVSVKVLGVPDGCQSSFSQEITVTKVIVSSSDQIMTKPPRTLP